MTTLVLAWSPDTGTLTLVRSDLTATSITYPPEGKPEMARSISKTILIATVTHDKVTRQWPVAAFNDTTQARGFVGFLNMAYASGDRAMLLLLDPRHARTAEGEPIVGVKYALAEVPYCPTPEVAADDVSEMAV